MSRHEAVEPDDAPTQPDLPVVQEESPAPAENESGWDWAYFILFVGVALVAAGITAAFIIWGDGWGNPGTDHPVWIPIT